MNDPAAAENFGEVTMSSPAAKDVDRSEELNFKTDKQNIIRMLGARFAERAADNDDHDRFVAENFNELKAQGFVEAGVPKEFGGGGASHAELSEMLRQIAGYCGSTALAFSMHTHQVAIAAWRWRHQKAPTEALLQRVAAEKMMLLSSGGSDWLQGSGTATRVDGGYRIDARKIFASGAPAGDLLMTSAVYQDPEGGAVGFAFCCADEISRRENSRHMAGDGNARDRIPRRRTRASVCSGIGDQSQAAARKMAPSISHYIDDCYSADLFRLRRYCRSRPRDRGTPCEAEKL
jgi:hypothetical protein